MAAQTSQAARRYRIDPQASEVRLLVYRDGPMARFGHNHVIIGQARGELFVGETAAASGFQIEIPVDSLVIDPVSARAEEGSEFSAMVSDPAREGTRKNLLSPAVLDGSAHPVIRIASAALAGPAWNPDVSAQVTIRGATRLIRFHAAVTRSGNDVTVIAAFRVVQSELGMTPFTVLGGAVQVRDAVDLRVRLVARPAER